MISNRIRHNKEAWFTESFLYLVSKGTRSEAASNSHSSCVLGKLQDGTLSKVPLEIKQISAGFSMAAIT